MSIMWQKRSLSRGTVRDQVMAVAVSPDSRYIAVGGFDGSVNVFDTVTLSLVHDFNITPPDDRPNQPVSAICFRPVATRPLLMVCTSSGIILRFNSRTWELSKRIVENENEIYACDYEPAGSFFATCGRDAAIRVYNDQTETIAHVFQVAAEYTTNVQPLRMLSVRFSRQNPNLLIAGGWGSALFTFDMREMEVETKKHGAIFGPVLTGDALDIVEDTVLAASHRIQERIVLYDLAAPFTDAAAAEAEEAVDASVNAGHTAPSGGPLSSSVLRTQPPLSAAEAALTAGKFATVKASEMAWPVGFQFLPQCAKLSPDGRFAACGGAGGEGMQNGGFVVDLQSKKAVVELKTTSCVNCLAFAPEGQFVVFGDGASQIHVFENKQHRAS